VSWYKARKQTRAIRWKSRWHAEIVLFGKHAQNSISIVHCVGKKPEILTGAGESLWGFVGGSRVIAGSFVVALANAVDVDVAGTKQSVRLCRSGWSEETKSNGSNKQR